MMVDTQNERVATQTELIHTENRKLQGAILLLRGGTIFILRRRGGTRCGSIFILRGDADLVVALGVCVCVWMCYGMHWGCVNV